MPVWEAVCMLTVEDKNLCLLCGGTKWALEIVLNVLVCFLSFNLVHILESF